MIDSVRRIRQHRQIAGNSCQAFDTALRLKSLRRGTIGKLVGMVRSQMIGTIRSQVLTYCDTSGSMDAVQRLNVGGPFMKGHKIQSIPLETGLLGGMWNRCHPEPQESPRGFLLLYSRKWNACWRTPTKKIHIIFYYSFNTFVSQKFELVRPQS